MSVFDSMKDFLKMNPSYDDYDEDDEMYDEDDYDDYEEDEPKRASRFEKPKSSRRTDNSVSGNRYQAEAEEEKASIFSRKTRQSSNVVSMSRRSYAAEIITFRPTSVEDSREIVDALLSKKAIILNFEGTSGDLAQRILDSMIGACCAVDGSIKKVSSYIFLVVPNTISVEGDTDDMAANSYEFRNRYQY